MGTRSLTHLYEENKRKPFCTIYRQFDGYPTGMGAAIKEILGEKELVNGYNDAAKQTNGMGCAAAMLIAGLKEGCGNVYIYPAGSKDCGEEYTYRIYPNGNTFRLKVEGYSTFDGNIRDFNPEQVEKGNTQ